jgi:type IV pilus assembly protein PilV
MKQNQAVIKPQTAGVVIAPSTTFRQRGVALLEVLIAFFILSIGLMGLAGLQMKSVQFSQSAYQRTQASMAIYDVLDMMRLNRAAAQTGAYDVSFSGTSSVADVTAWKLALQNGLPNGQGSINCVGNDICTISIQWDDRFSTVAGTKETLVITSQM